MLLSNLFPSTRPQLLNLLTTSNSITHQKTQLQSLSFGGMFEIQTIKQQQQKHPFHLRSIYVLVHTNSPQKGNS